jgi:hypothetical protein
MIMRIQGRERFEDSIETIQAPRYFCSGRVLTVDLLFFRGYSHNGKTASEANAVSVGVRLRRTLAPRSVLKRT